MKRHWDDAELSDGWSLSHVEFELLKNRTASTRLGFAALPKFFIFKGQFPKESEKCPAVAIQYLAEQLDVLPEAFDGYDFSNPGRPSLESVLSEIAKLERIIKLSKIAY